MTASGQDKEAMYHQQLIERHYLGALSDEESAELETLLLKDPSLRADFLSAATLDSDLRDTALKQEAETADLHDLPRSNRPSILKYVAVAAGLIIAVSVVLFSMNHSRSPAIAMLANISGDVSVSHDSKLRRADVGHAFVSGTEIKTSGPRSTAFVIWQDGSSMKLEGDTVLRMVDQDGQKHVSLVRGAVKCDIVKQGNGKPLMLTTSHSRIMVIGTSFRARTTANASVTEVIHGVVKVERLSDKDTVTLFAQEKVTVDERPGTRS